MKNDDIKNFLEWEAPHKFDICLTNPPYGSVGGDTLHLKFVDKCLDCCENIISVFPFTFMTKTSNKPAQKYKDRFDKYLLNVEEIASKIFNETDMPNVGIYVFSNEKKDEDIEIFLFDKTMRIKSINDSILDQYDKKILSYLDNKQVKGTTQGYHHSTQKSLLKKGYISQSVIDDIIDSEIRKTFNELNEGRIYLMCNNSNGKMNGTFFTSKNGLILNAEEVKKTALERKKGYVFLEFKNIESAKNCKNAMCRPLLRFTSFRLQDDQNMTYKKVYKCIPDIDWEDDRCLTDEGLLEMCGCPKEKAKEYANYCKNVMDKVDNL